MLGLIIKAVIFLTTIFWLYRTLDKKFSYSVVTEGLLRDKYMENDSLGGVTIQKYFATILVGDFSKQQEVDKITFVRLKIGENVKITQEFSRFTKKIISSRLEKY